MMDFKLPYYIIWSVSGHMMLQYVVIFNIQYNMVECLVMNEGYS